MKEINLTLTKENELSFEKPEPYITIHIANKETYEKLVNVIDKNTPAEVEVKTVAGLNSQRCEIICPLCANVIGHGRTEVEALSFVERYCPNCGQAVTYSEVQQ